MIDRVSADPAELACIEAALREDDLAINAAIAYNTGPSGVNHGWSSAADRLTFVELADCPADFATAFSSYVESVDEVGAFLEDRTGTAAIDDMFDRSSDRKYDSLLSELNSRYSTVGTSAAALGVEAPRGSIVTADR